ncbi:MAG: OBAP family protein [Pseudobacter sp.]|uniref:OBAP family protein n=1 Tax=Pseudobacter sp. TaxID=2045420 RepID=UPI003F7D6EA7
MKRISPVAFACMLLAAACGGRNTSSNVEPPGQEKTAKDKALNTGANLLQSKTPISRISAYLNGFHFYNGNIDAQMEAHHYVSQLNEDLYQAIIFDGNKEDAKIMGVEYIITEKLFKTLPEEEKKLWHSHHHEVSSGTLIAPGIPMAVEHELMEKLISTYGKTIHTWHTDQERSLPMGSPMIMMGFTKEGQLNSSLLADRDKRFNISTEERKKNRMDISIPAVDPSANAWEKGEIRQFIISNKPDSALNKRSAKPGAAALITAGCSVVSADQARY